MKTRQPAAPVPTAAEFKFGVESNAPTFNGFQWRLGDHGTFRTRRRDGGLVAVRGLGIEFVGEDIPLLARQQPWFAYRNHEGRWFVVHGTRGMAAGRGVTLREALARAIENLQHATERELTESFYPTMADA